MLVCDNNGHLHSLVSREFVTDDDFYKKLQECYSEPYSKNGAEISYTPGSVGSLVKLLKSAKQNNNNNTG